MKIENKRPTAEKVKKDLEHYAQFIMHEDLKAPPEEVSAKEIAEVYKEEEGLQMTTDIYGEDS